MTMPLDEWIEKTPGMARLEKDILIHLDQIIGPPNTNHEDAVRVIMISVRQAIEEDDRH